MARNALAGTGTRTPSNAVIETEVMRRLESDILYYREGGRAVPCCGPSHGRRFRSRRALTDLDSEGRGQRGGEHNGRLVLLLCISSPSSPSGASLLLRLQDRRRAAMASAALRPETSAPSTHCTRSSQQASPAKRSRPPHSAEASTPHMSLPACAHATPQSSSKRATERQIR